GPAGGGAPGRGRARGGPPPPAPGGRAGGGGGGAGGKGGGPRRGGSGARPGGAPPPMAERRRLDDTFARLRRDGARALIPYFTAGDPSLEVTRLLVEEADARGADVIEVGLPFSDPLADGPTIQ